MSCHRLCPPYQTDFALRVLSPPPSLSLPRKGGGNAVARLCSISSNSFALATVCGGGDRRVARYISNMSPAIKELFEQVASWPQEDQEELAELARQIEARRTGVYRATPEELQALDEAERSGIASDEEVEAAFRS